MTQSTAVLSKNEVHAKGKASLVPPDERFWKRYSPRHEFPVSLVSSLSLHALAVGLLFVILFFGWVLVGRDKGLSIDVVQKGGGGGHPNGVGNNPGDGDLPARQADIPQTDPTSPVQPTVRENLPTQATPPAPVQVPDLENQAALKRLIADGNQTAIAISKLEKDTLERLRTGLLAGAGKGGSGQGGGQGTGRGTGTGPGVGPGDGSGKLDIRTQRVLRWMMTFNTENGQDYAKQLNGLGAFLAIPDPQKPKQYLVIRDLTQRPVKGAVQDIGEIKRIFWIDDQRDSIKSLSTALGLRQTPTHVVAFFPQELEDELLRLELAYDNRKEEDIEETRFEILRAGGGYKPVVKNQRLYRR